MGRFEELTSRWEPVIGLEVHAQLLTRTKLFCGCANRFGAPPNTLVCPVCLGLPGALPVLNRRAVTLALRAALATGCTVHSVSVFERKNYFYPDLPKGYQISQYERPLATGGFVAIDGPDGAEKRVRLARIHMEEDAGKLLHEGFPWSGEKSGVDLNRAGVPLIEIVSEPDLRTPEEAHAYLTALRAVLLYAEVSDGNMEEGSLRCDANVSVRRRGERRPRHPDRDQEPQLVPQRGPGPRARDRAAGGGPRVGRRGRPGDPPLERGPGRDGVRCAPRRRPTTTATSPSPTCPPSRCRAEWVEEARRSLPELPAERRRRFASEYGLPDYDAGVLTQEREVADYFEAAARASGNAKAASNWVMTEVLRKLKDDERGLAACPVGPAALAGLVRLIDAGTISGKIAKDVFERMWATGEEASAIVEREGLTQLSDETALEAVVAEVVAASPEQAASYRGGKAATLGWFVGQVMRRTGGRGQPAAGQRPAAQGPRRGLVARGRPGNVAADAGV